MKRFRRMMAAILVMCMLVPLACGSGAVFAADITENTDKGLDYPDTGYDTTMPGGDNSEQSAQDADSTSGTESDSPEEPADGQDTAEPDNGPDPNVTDDDTDSSDNLWPDYPYEPENNDDDSVEPTDDSDNTPQPADDEINSNTTDTNENSDPTQTEQPETLSPAFDLWKIIGNIIVRVQAPEGVFPEGAKLSVRKLSESQPDGVAAAEAVEEERDGNCRAVDTFIFDISVTDSEGSELQPDTAHGDVTVSFRLAEQAYSECEFDIYHIEDNGSTAERLSTTDTTDSSGATIVTANTDSFSVYVVDITTPTGSLTRSLNVSPGDVFTVKYLISQYFGVNVEPIYITSSNESIVGISDDLTKLVIGNSTSSSPVQVSVKDTRGDEYIFNITVVGNGKQDLHLRVLWNDNHSDTAYNITSRPYPASKAADMTGLFKLYYQIEGEDTRKLLTQADCAALGLDSLPQLQYAGNISEEIYDFVYAGLPRRTGTYNLGGSVQDTPSRAITWTIEQTTTFSGYDAPVVKPYDSATGAITIMNTAHIKWNANMIWKDASNRYSTRPTNTAASSLVVYRGVAGGTATLLDASQYQLTITPSTTDSNKSIISIVGASGYDPETRPYVYIIKDSNLSAGDYGYYAPVYKNTDNYAQYEDYLYIGGNLQRTLTNTTTYNVDKRWIDADADPATRPSPILHLYRMSERYDDEGKIVIDVTNYLEPVPSFDYMAVPKQDSVYVYTGASDSTELPMYDSEGRRYIYFALETGAGDYVVNIDNDSAVASPDATANQQIINGFEQYKKDGQVKYLLNGGILKNWLDVTIAVPVKKEFKASSMQSMLDDAVVVMQLQKYVEGTDWTDVTQDDIIEGSASATGELVFEDFNADNMTASDNSVKVHMYDEDGNRVYYRWIEKSLTIDGDTTVSPSFTTEWSETGEYSGGTINLGLTGPETAGENSTALYMPHASVDYTENSTVLSNTLTGEIRIRVTKTWTDESGTLTPEQVLERGLTAKFTLIRNDGASTAVAVDAANKLLDRDGNPVSDLIISGAEGATELAGMWKNLDRYDENGVEYAWKINEEESGWHQTSSLSSAIVENEAGQKIKQINCGYDNSTGDTKCLRFDTTKTWTDDSDLSTRKPVLVQVIRIRDLDGQLLDTPEVAAEDTLCEDNEWFAKIEIMVEDTDVCSNYVVIEKSVGGVPVDYSTDYAGVYNNAVNSPEKPIATIERITPADTWQLSYGYDVFISVSDSNEGNTQEYEISNLRTGQVELRLNKTWKASGLTPDAGFSMLKNDVEIASFVLHVQDGEATLTNCSGFENIDYVVNYSTASHTAGIVFRSADSPDGTGFEKYDENGNLNLYSFVETTVGGVDIVDNVAVVNGDRFVCSAALESTVKVPSSHLCGEIFTWSSTNIRSDSTSLNAYAVWWDDGAICIPERPGARFNVYRIIVDDDMSDLVADVTAGKTDARDNLTAAVAAKADGAELIYVDKIWDTELNQWLWECNLGSVPKYDGNGNAYIYFLVASTEVGTTEYVTSYYEDTLEPDFTGAAPDKILPGVTKSDLNSTLLILADGVNDYSRSVVNYRESSRTISMRKLWHIDEGTWDDISKFPSVYIELYRLTGDQRTQAQEQGYITAEDEHSYTIGEYFNLHSVEPVDHVTLPWNGEYSYVFGTNEHNEKLLDKYDEYGHKYYYYTLENNTKLSKEDQELLRMYRDEDVTYEDKDARIHNYFKMGAPYVRIEFTKKWAVAPEFVGVYNLTELKPATFTLMAQAVDADGNPDGEPLVMDTVTLNPADLAAGEDSISYTFEYYREYEANPNQRLPYYGPSGQPLQYYIAEGGMTGYTQKIKIGTQAEKTCVPDTGNLVTTIDEPIFDNIINDLVYDQAESIVFTNTYSGASTSFAFTKAWNDSDGFTNNISLRPELKFTVWRRYTNSNGDVVVEQYYHKNSSGEKSVIDTAQAASASGWKLVKDDAHNQWTVTLTGLNSTAPGGETYQYFVQSEEGPDGSKAQRGDNGVLSGTITATDAEYTYSASAGAGTLNRITNTLNVNTVSIKKVFLKNNEDTEVLSFSDFSNRLNAGGLPTALIFALQSKTGSEEWNFVTAGSGLNEESVDLVIGGTAYSDVIGRRFALADVTAATYGRWIHDCAVKFSKLPNDGTTIYRAVEIMEWETGMVLVDNTATSGGMTGTLSLVSATATDRVYKATNVMPHNVFSLTKEWIDAGNRDHLRDVTFNLYQNYEGDEGTVTALYQSIRLYSDPKAEEDTILIEAKDANGAELPEDFYTFEKALGGDTDVWSLTFNYLPEIIGSKEITYTASEVYNSVESDKFASGKAFSNTRDPATFSITASKVWSDNSDRYGLRPDSVKLTLEWTLTPDDDTSWSSIFASAPATTADDPGDNVYTSDTVTQTVSYDTTTKAWTTAQWEDLPTRMIAEGKSKTVYYRVRETDENVPKGYDQTFSTYSTEPDAPADVTDATVTNTLQVRNLNVRKYWKNEDESRNFTYDEVNALINEGVLPSKLSFAVYYKTDSTAYKRLQSNGKDYTKTISTLSFFNSSKNYKSVQVAASLPQYDKDGNQITYQVRELTQTVNVTSADSSGVKLTKTTTTADVVNTYAYTSRSVTKIWHDEANRENERMLSFTLKRDGNVFITVNVTTANPAAATVKIADGTVLPASMYEIKKDATDSNRWLFTWKYLPVRNAGDTADSVYTITESDTHADVVTDLEDDTVVPTTGLEVNNAFQPDKGSLTVTKVWDDNSNAYNQRPETVSFKLQYSTDSGNTWTDITKGTLSAQQGKDLYPDGGVYTTSEPVQSITKAAGNKQATWTGPMWNNLPIMYYNSTSSVKVLYRVLETDTGAYNITYSLNNSTFSSTPVSTNVTNDTDANIYVKNSGVELSVSKSWTYQDGSPYVTDIYHVWPKSITAQLQQKNASGTWTDVKTPSGFLIEVELLKTANYAHTFKNLQKDKDYRVVETGLTYDTVGTVNFEPYEAIAFFTISYTGSGTQATGKKASITNTMYGTDLTVAKTWEDGNDRDRLRPDSIKVKVYRDLPTEAVSEDCLVAELTLNKANGWKATVKNLPKYQNGYCDAEHMSEYTVVEQSYTNSGKYTATITVYNTENTKLSQVTGTTAALTLSDARSVQLLNSHAPAVIKVTGTKKWQDNEDRYSLRPEETYLTLQYSTSPDNETSWKAVENTGTIDPATDDGTKVYTTDSFRQRVTATDSGWTTASWDNLPAYLLVSGEQKKVYYRAYEESAGDVPGGYEIYSFTGVGTDDTDATSTAETVLTNALITGSDLIVKKAWTDKDLQLMASYGTMPHSVSVQLQYRTKDSDEDWSNISTASGKAELSTANQWKHVFESINIAVYEYRAIETYINYMTSDGLVSVPVIYGKSEGKTDQTKGTGLDFVYSSVTEYIENDKDYYTELKNAYITGELTVDLTWLDGNNRDGVRPATVKLQLYRDMPDNAGSASDDYKFGPEVTLSQDDFISAQGNNVWSYKWTDLPVFKENSDVWNGRTEETKSVYRVMLVTDVSDEYDTDDTMTTQLEPATDTGVYTGSLNIVGEHEPKLIGFCGEKLWQDNGNSYGLRDKSVKLTIEYSLDSGATWKSDIEVLPIADRPDPENDAGAAVYSVSALTQQLLASEQSESTDANRWTGTEWTGLSAFALADPDDFKSSTKVLYRLTEQSDNIPAGYAVTESAAASYQAVDSEDVVLTVTNSIITGSDLLVKKAWTDKDLQLMASYGTMPYSVSVQLQYRVRNSDEAWTDIPTDTGRAELNEDNLWTHTYTDINYTVYEFRAVETHINYSTTAGIISVPVLYSQTDDATDPTTGTALNFIYSSHTDELTGDKDYYTELANAYVTGELTLDLTWFDGNNRDGVRPEKVTIQLYRDLPEENGGQDDNPGSTDPNENINAQDDDYRFGPEITLSQEDFINDNSNNVWSYTWTDLPVYKENSEVWDGRTEETKSVYRVKLVTDISDEYSADDTMTTALEFDEAEAGFTGSLKITGIHQPKVFDFSGHKLWIDNDDNYGLRDSDVKLTVEYSLDDGATWQRGIEVLPIEDRPDPENDTGATVYSVSALTQMLSASSQSEEADSNEWSGGEWTGLSAFALSDPDDFRSSTRVQYRLTETESDIPASYVVIESATVSYSDDDTSVATVTAINKLQELKIAMVSKVFNFGNDSDLFGVKPDAINVRLQSRPADGTGEWTDVPRNGTAVLNEENNWSYIFSDGLRDSLDYRVVEKSVVYGDLIVEIQNVTDDDFTQTGTIGSFIGVSSTEYNEETKTGSTTITNTLPETKLQVLKSWQDEEYASVHRTESVTVQLTRDGENIGEPVTLSEDTGWSHEWSYLPVYRNGSEEKSVYAVVETEIEGYTAVYDSQQISFIDVSPADFINADAQTLQGATVSIGIVNTIFRGTVQVTKTDVDYPESRLTGAEFEVYSGEELIGSMTETENGVYTLENVPYGEYILKETKAPEGFLPDENAYSFSITQDGETVTVENEQGKGFVNAPQTGGLKIVKTSQDGVLEGFTFKLEGKDITGNTFSKTYVTDEKGTIEIEGLRIGTYVVSEVSDDATKKYDIPDNQTVTIKTGETAQISFYNKLKPITFTGDTNNPGLWAALMSLSFAGLAAGAGISLKKKKESGR